MRRCPAIVLHEVAFGAIPIFVARRAKWHAARSRNACVNVGETRLRLACPVCAATFRARYAYCPADGSKLRPCTHLPFAGKIVAGRYLIESLLGEGAMGVVYRARDTSRQRTIAIKVLRGELAADSTSRLRFAREFALTRKLSHPNVVGVIGYGCNGPDPPHLVMEYSDGETLRDAMERKSPPTPARAIDIGRQLAAGLSHVHAAGLVHRDLKPENVILERRPRATAVPRILDFGLAISRQAQSRPSSRLTAVGYAMGTPGYLAPEQLQRRCVDQRADLFSLGVILYELLVGETPFDGTILQVVHGSVPGRVVPMRERNPESDVAAPLEAVVCRLLAREPDDRFQSADEVAAALEDAARQLAT